MSASFPSPRNPAVRMSAGDVVRSYGGGVDLVIVADYDEDNPGAYPLYVSVLDLESMVTRWHATAATARDIVARGVRFGGVR